MADIKLDTSFTGPVDPLPVLHTGGADVGSGGYLLSDGKSFMAPLPTVVSPSGSYRDRAGNLLHAVAFAATPASDPLLAPYLAAMNVQPTNDQADIIDLFCKTLRDANMLRFDRYYQLHSHDEQASRINLMNPSETLLVPINAPTFTAYSGWKGDGSTQDLRMPGAFSFTGSKYTQDDASYGCFIVEQPGPGNRSLMGNISDSIQNLQVSNSSNGSWRINDNNADVVPMQTIRTGLWIATRAAGVKSIFYDKTVVATLTRAATGLSAAVGCAMRGASAYNAHRFAAVFSGASLTEADRDALYDALAAYRTEYVA